MGVESRVKALTFLKNTHRGLLELIENITIADAILFSVIPVVILVTEYISLISNSFKIAFAFHYHDPQWWQYVSSAYVHSDFSHFYSNFSAYYIVGIICFLLAVNIKRQRDFFILLFTTAICLPIVESIIKVTIYPLFLPNLYNQYDIALGTSGVISAILGFIPAFWIANVSQKSGKNQYNAVFYLICMIYIAFMFEVTYAQYVHSIVFYLTAFSLVLFLGLYFPNCVEIGQFILREAAENTVSYWLIFLSPFLFLLYPLFLLPQNPIGLNVDFFAHYFGIAFGVFICYLYFVVGFKCQKKF